MLFSAETKEAASEVAEQVAPLSSIDKIVEIIVAVVIAAFFIFLLRKLFRKYSGPDSKDVPKEKKTMMKILYSFLNFAVILVCVLSILSTMGMDISKAFAACGIAAACGGLAVQDLLKDLIQGMNIVSGRFFSIGDVIQYKGFTGKVISLTMRSTKIQSLNDASILTIGNHFLTEITLISAQVNLKVSLPYELEKEKAFEIMQKISDKIAQSEHTIDSEFKGISTFEETSMTYLIVYHCNPELKENIKQEINLIVKQILDEAEIKMPFQQVGVYIKKNTPYVN